MNVNDFMPDKSELDVVYDFFWVVICECHEVNFGVIDKEELTVQW